MIGQRVTRRADTGLAEHEDRLFGAMPNDNHVSCQRLLDAPAIGKTIPSLQKDLMILSVAVPRDIVAGMIDANDS